MRLWTLHPKYLDAKGLVALWREALLAKAVLSGQTRGYKHHPQLERFRSHPKPLNAIDAYLHAVHVEAQTRGYSFDGSKIGPVRVIAPILTTTEQVAFESRHLLNKLSARSPDIHKRWCDEQGFACHPVFKVRRGPIESWEKAAAG